MIYTILSAILLWIDHHLGISLITLAFMYLLYTTITKNKALLPPLFYFLYGFGGLFIFSEMYDSNKQFVYMAELLGVIMTLGLGIHSYLHYK